jgi:FixJ family two-component response regulator
VRKATLCIVDSDGEERYATARFLEEHGMLCRGYGAVEVLLSEPAPRRPSCLVIDAGAERPAGVLRELRERGIPSPVVFLSPTASVPEAVEAMQLGAHSYIEKPFDPRSLLRAVEAGLAADRRAAFHDARRRRVRRRIERLTPRRRQVLEQVVQGHTNKAIAIDLGLSRKTVELHRARMFETMGASSVAELVTLWIAAHEPDELICGGGR